MSHVPLHPASITERWGINIHGHYHANIVERQVDRGYHMSGGGGSYYESNIVTEPDPLYISVCVEQIDYRPIEMTELKERIATMREKYGDGRDGR